MEILKKNKILTSFIILVVALVTMVNIYMIFLYESVKISASLVLYLIFCFAPLCAIGVWGMIKLDIKWQKVLLICVLAIVYAFIILHSHIKSWDYICYLSNWFKSYSQGSLKDALYKIIDVSNYTPFYNYFLIIIARCGFNSLYSIKYVTYLFSFLFAFSTEKVISHIRNEKFNILRFAVVLLLPPVLMEYTAWGQCDVIYTSFALLSFYFALSKKSKLSFMFIGISFAFKLQFLFIVPILFVMLIVKDEKGEHYLKWKDIWIAPLPYLINLLPAIAGRSVVELLLVYISQSKYDARISGDCANLGYIFYAANASFLDSKLTPLFMFMLTIILMVVLLVIVFRYNELQGLTKIDLLYFGMVFAFIMVFFMPKMLDRFYFISMSLSFIYLCSKPSKQSILTFISVSGSLFFMMSLHLLHHNYKYAIAILGLICAIASLVLFTITLIKKYCKKIKQEKVKEA